jgi:argininosuccinate lyase
MSKQLGNKRLWDKGEQLDEEVQAFSVGNDPELDIELLPFDIQGSIAHAQMLVKIGILSNEEFKQIKKSLIKLLKLVREGSFSIPVELEDGHTAIETFLANDIGSAGLRIHTGRSRNDQILVASRLYLREKTLKHISQLSAICEALFERCEECQGLPMPGYTHMQKAMPSSVTMWLHAFSEAFLEMIREGLFLLDRLNTNPLGVASGYGVPLPLDRKMTTDLLAFDKVQRSPIDVQNSRGRYELKFVRWNVDIVGVVEKLAWDLLIYSMKEFSFFSLPPGLRTGSSIMPQKKNPDVLELLRGRAGKVRACESELLWVTSKLPSNYHRDLQYTKEPFLRSTRNVTEILNVLHKVIVSFEVHEEPLKAAMTDDLYATYDVYRAIQDGTTFREAYQRTGKKLADDTFTKDDLESDFEMIQATVDSEIIEAKADLKSCTESLKQWTNKIEDSKKQLFSS